MYFLAAYFSNAAKAAGPSPGADVSFPIYDNRDIQQVEFL